MTTSRPGQVPATDATGATYEGTGSRELRPTALGRGTHGVPEVRRLVEDQLRVAFPHRVWVTGRVDRVEGDGALGFVLRAADDDEAFALPCVVPAERLPAVADLLQATHDAVLDDVVRAGRLARVGGLLRLDPAQGTVVLQVSELDPTPTAAALQQQRRSATRQVADSGLTDVQRRLPLPPSPLEVAVVGPDGDPAVALVQQHLVEAGGPPARAVPVDLAGDGAAARLAEGLASAARGSDIVLLVRSGGRPLGLAPFDAPEAARALAESPVPVVTGLGGGSERTACDEVAFAALPDAGSAAARVAGWQAEARRSLEAVAGQVSQEASAARARCRSSLEAAADAVEQALPAARERSRRIARNRQVALVVACVLVAAAVVAGALLTDRPLALLLLAVPAAALAAGVLRARVRSSGRSTRVSKRAEDFDGVVGRLHAVRDELSRATSPQRVTVLEQEAEQLVERGRTLLGTSARDPGPAAEADGEPAS